MIVRPSTKLKKDKLSAADRVGSSAISRASAADKYLFLSMSLHYRGRFAPSPTGPLHFGSLISALVSYLDARHSGGQWLVRIEDIDPPREIPGAADTILSQLDAHGLQWDDDVLYQSRRQDAYLDVLDMRNQGILFPCRCTRQQLAAQGASTVSPAGAATSSWKKRMPYGFMCPLKR
ncbi:MAG: glutamate--tRNA ligase family protein [Porticoccaceae bacterium]